MRKPYHSLRRRAASLTLWGVLVILAAITFLCWPDKRLRIERQIWALANGVSHQGATVSSDWLRGLSETIEANCSRTTTFVRVEGAVNQAFTQAELVDALAGLAATSTRLEVKLEPMTITLSGAPERAQVNVDAAVEIERDQRVDRERRHVFISLQQDGGQYRVVAVEASAKVVDQPEPRP
jgi:hypothetical protein